MSSLNNLFPVIEEPTIVTEVAIEAQEVTFNRSYSFDFKKGDFRVSPSGKVVETTGQDAWIEWCFKALMTARYRFVAYSRFHGQEFDDLIARDLTRAANESEIERITTETLMRDPRTESVGGFTFRWDKDKVFFECAIRSIYGQAQVNQTVEVAQ